MKTENILPDLTTPRVMAIVNVTPDSFFAGSRTPDAEAIERRVREAADAGCDLFDVGGYSSRSGAAEVTPEEEWRRVEAGVAAVRRIAPALPVSVDRFRAEVARRVLETFGPVIVNDISAGEMDPAIVDVVAEYDVPYIAMHMRGTPATMQGMTSYRDVVEEVVSYFRLRAEQLRRCGVRRLILDPGFGFAKTLEQNYDLLRGLHNLCSLGYPVLAGVSRKSMIYKVLDTTPDRALAGTIALGWECLRQGAAILRVHDVRDALEVLRGVSLEVSRGEVVSIVGASGAGKTTLLQILGTLSKADRGSVEIDGQDVSSLGDRALSRFRNEKIGFVFQFHHLLPEFTAFENVCIPGLIGRRPKAEVERRAGELLALVGLTQRRDHKPGELSGGEQQRVAIARALVNSPAVLLDDEPSGNLDTRNKEEVHRLFFDLRERLGQTIVLVTHDESLALRADRRIVMSDGLILPE